MTTGHENGSKLKSNYLKSKFSDLDSSNKQILN